MDSNRARQEFNMAVSELTRINLVCATIEDSMMRLDIHNWYNGLQVLSAILERHMKKKENEGSKFDERLEQAWINVNNYLSLKQRVGVAKIEPTTYKELKIIYTDLRRIADEAGILGREEDDDFE